MPADIQTMIDNNEVGAGVNRTLLKDIGTSIQRLNIIVKFYINQNL